jgi:Mrp family chromosome partitioning ATPase
MPRIYDALKAAEQERGANAGGESLRPPKSGKAARPFREKMVGVYQSIESRLVDMPSRVIAFVGAKPGEGASTLIREFACVVCGELGKRVALLDGDQGFGRHQEYFAITLGTTCKDVIEGRCGLEDALQPTGVDGLFLGHLAGDGASLSSVASKPAFEDIMQRLREDFELVLVDAPPLSESSDAVLLAAKSDGVVLVVEAEKTRWQVAQSMRDRLGKQKAEILGVILNKRRYYIPRAIYARL